MRESVYQANLIFKLTNIFPDCIVLKNDPDHIQGIPDLLILFEDKWAALEVKTSRVSPTRPNQRHYVDVLNSMSYCAIIYPENEEVILDEIQCAFGFRR